MQVSHEQPGCIHTSMDLFKYACLLYPFVPSSLLQRCLSLAFEARFLDMRASPYDVSMFAGCEDAIRVETDDGRRAFIVEQKALYKKSQPLREKLLHVYNAVLASSAH